MMRRILAKPNLHLIAQRIHPLVPRHAPISSWDDAQLRHSLAPSSPKAPTYFSSRFNWDGEMRGGRTRRVGAALRVARDSHLCASITDDHSWVHLVRVLDAALTDKQVGKGRGEGSSWLDDVGGWRVGRRRRFHRRCCPEISRNYLSLSCVSALCLFPSNRSALLSSINRHLHTVSRPRQLTTTPAPSSTTREFTDSCNLLRNQNCV